MYRLVKSCIQATLKKIFLIVYGASNLDRDGGKTIDFFIGRFKCNPCRLNPIHLP